MTSCHYQDSTTLESEDALEDASYELRVVKMPILTGWKLKLVAMLANSGVGHRYILPYFPKMDHVFRLRHRALKEKPTYYPLPRIKTLDVKEEPVDTQRFVKPSSEKLPFHFMTISDYVMGYRSGHFDPIEAMDWVIESIKKSNEGEKPLRAVISFHEAEIRDMARASKQRWEKKAMLSILDGVPIAVKDEIDVEGYPTTGGTIYTGKELSNKDAVVVQALRDAGAIIIGKTNMHELGLGTTGCNPRKQLGIVRNPYDPTCYAGGSSGGSAAAVASGKHILILYCKRWSIFIFIFF
jgi:hypothetical protein